MTLSVLEFVRRFLLHVLPFRFVKIRYYGLLAQSQRATTLPRCRELLSAPSEPPASAPIAPQTPDFQRASEPPRCPSCERGRLRRLPLLPPPDSS
jgi:rubredoxin